MYIIKPSNHVCKSSLIITISWQMLTHVLWWKLQKKVFTFFLMSHNVYICLFFIWSINFTLVLMLSILVGPKLAHICFHTPPWRFRTNKVNLLHAYKTINICVLDVTLANPYPNISCQSQNFTVQNLYSSVGDRYFIFYYQIAYPHQNLYRMYR